MTTSERIKNWQVHDSQRGVFAFELYKQMAQNRDIWLLVGDLGYHVFDAHFEDFPDRTINCGAAEQVMLDMAVGLAYNRKIPLAYSITPFLIYRPLETLRTYINHENIPVKLVGSGRDMDYAHDGYSHDARDVRKIISVGLPQIEQYWPERIADIPNIVESMIKNGLPSFISLSR
jgi:transketolase